MPSLYEISIPVFIRQLKNLQGVLKKSQAWAHENGKPDSFLLEARLAPDMQPLPFQIKVITRMVLSGVFTTNWKWFAPAADPENPKDFEAIYARIQAVIDELEQIKSVDETGSQSRPFSIWPSGVEGQGPEFKFATATALLQEFLLPNVYFHYSISYAICRAQGVPLGKVDFLAAGGTPFTS